VLCRYPGGVVSTLSSAAASSSAVQRPAANATISPLRYAPALALLTLTATLAGCGASHGSPRVVSAAGASSMVGPPAPSGFVVPSGIADPLCNGGRGVRLGIPSWQEDGEGRTAITTSGAVAGGSTVIAFSGYQGKGLAVLHSVTPRCELDRQFGADGAAMITVPSSLRPPRPSVRGYGLRDGLAIDVVAARNGGGAIVAGNYEGEWVVGEVTKRGTVDTSFGNDGWASLPFPAGVDAILQERSGRIVVAGGNGGGGCCTTNWAAALSARGQPDSTFGRHGRVKLPTGESSRIDKLELEPNGDILVDVRGGNMGCWYTKPAMLTPSGEPVPLFAKRLARFQQGLGLQAFVGDVYIEGEGFALVGTGQKPCFSPPHSAPSATGLIARFQPNGAPAGPIVWFPSRLYGSVDAFRGDDDTFLVENPWDNRTQVTVTARRTGGSLDPRFGDLGQVQIRTAGTADVGTPTSVSMTNAAPMEATLVAILSERAELQLVRLRL
jgi:hypothetical protein